MIQLFHADFDVLGEHKIEESGLLFVETGTDGHLGIGGPFVAGECGQRISKERKYVEEVTLFGVNDALHLS